MGIIDYIEQRNRERVFRARVEDSKKVGFGLFLGLAVGAGIGLLTAPKSGEETREDLVKVARDAGTKVRAKADEYVGLAREMGADMQSKLTSIRPALESGLSAAEQKYGEALAERKSTLEESAEEVKEGAKDVAEDVKKGAKKVAEDVKETAKDVKKDVKETAESVEKKTK